MKKKPHQRWGINGGAFSTDYPDIFPKIQVIDKITREPKNPPVDEFFLKQKYLGEGLSSAEIAKLTFSSRPTITKLLKRHGIPLKIYTRRNDGAHVYGHRKYGGKTIELKKEQEVIELIKTYRESGYSYQKIADILNQEKIETKLKKGFWYSKVVRSLALRT